MEKHNSFFMIPTELIDNVEHFSCVLPVFAFLQCRRGLDCKITTSIKDLIYMCGYSTASRSNIKRHLPEIQEALTKLFDMGYIYQFLDSTGFITLDDEAILSMAAGNYFTIEINTDLTNEPTLGFVAVNINEYEKLYNALIRQDPEMPLWKILSLYLYIYRYMWKRQGFLKEDRTKLTDEIVEKCPEYAFFKIDTMSEKLGSGFSKGTITKIIKYLESIEMIHMADFFYGEKIIRDQIGNERVVPCKRGTIFVRDSIVWQTEVESALYSKFKEYKKYYQKGGQGDI